MPREAAALKGRQGDPAAVLREHLVDVAETLLADRSIGSITTRELARAAAVSDGVLYNHFADKHDLLLTALVRTFSRLVEDLHAGTPSAGVGTVHANLLQHAEALLEFHLAARPLAGKLAAEPALLARFVEAIHSPDLSLGGSQVRDPLVEYIEAETRLGRLCPCDAGAAADLLIGAVALAAFTAGAGAASKLGPLVDTLIAGLANNR